MSDIIIELGSDRWTKTEAGWYLECIAESGKVAYDGIPNRAERRFLEEIARLRAESDANRREAEIHGRFELHFVEELDAIKAAVKFEETADSDGPITLVQWCSRMAAEVVCLNDVANRTCRENERRTLEISHLKDELSDVIGEKATLNAEIERLRVASDRLTECDLQSIDWDERTITLRYPAEIDGLEVRAGLKIKADLTPMQPNADTEPPVADQASIL